MPCYAMSFYADRPSDHAADAGFFRAFYFSLLLFMRSYMPVSAASFPLLMVFIAD